jgi:hypothetical protein
VSVLSACSSTRMLADAAASTTQSANDRLRKLQEVRCALPDCNYQELARAAGLQWHERRAPLLTRAVIARSPQVGPHLITIH